MAIDQLQISTLLSQCGDPANTSGRKVWICDGGNMATAMLYFKLITGQEFSPATARRIPTEKENPKHDNRAPGAWKQVAKGGFLLQSCKGSVGAGKEVTVTLRGGSSSTIEGPGNPHHGPPTVEIQPAEHLSGVPQLARYIENAKKVIVEVKFTTRAEHAQWAEYAG